MYGYGIDLSDIRDFYLIYTIVTIVVAIIFGCITKAINEGKGRYGGFAWGFWLGWIGIIVVACRPAISYAPKESIIVPARPTNVKADPVMLSDGRWQCVCGRQNARYVSSCTCGANKSAVFNPKPAQQEPVKETHSNNESANIAALKEYKALLDSGVITQEEFDTKKNAILSR